MSTAVGKLRESSLGSLTAVANGTPVYIGDLVDCVAGVGGTFVGTWSLKVSFDGGTTYVQFDSGTAAKVVTLPRCSYARLDCTAFTSGTIVGGFGGTDYQRL